MPAGTVEKSFSSMARSDLSGIRVRASELGQGDASALAGVAKVGAEIHETLLPGLEQCKDLTRQQVPHSAWRALDAVAAVLASRRPAATVPTVGRERRRVAFAARC